LSITTKTHGGVDMDNSVLKKRLNTYKTSKGTLSKVSDDVVMEVLRNWENWPGKSIDLYRELGLSKMQMVTMIQKAKRLVKNGAVFPDSDFKEIKINSESGQIIETAPCSGVEILWSNGKVIRFSQVDLLIDFLKKAA
jgi:hypothetical protein